jgi:hypothetical protein
VTGEVLSLKEGYTDLIALFPAYLFHAASTALGAFLIAGSIERKASENPKVRAAA